MTQDNRGDHSAQDLYRGQPTTNSYPESREYPARPTTAEDQPASTSGWQHVTSPTNAPYAQAYPTPTTSPIGTHPAYSQGRSATSFGSAADYVPRSTYSANSEYSSPTFPSHQLSTDAESVARSSYSSAPEYGSTANTSYASQAEYGQGHEYPSEDDYLDSPAQPVRPGSSSADEPAPQRSAGYPGEDELSHEQQTALFGATPSYKAKFGETHPEPDYQTASFSSPTSYNTPNTLYGNHNEYQGVPGYPSPSSYSTPSNYNTQSGYDPRPAPEQPTYASAYGEQNPGLNEPAAQPGLLGEPAALTTGNKPKLPRGKKPNAVVDVLLDFPMTKQSAPVLARMMYLVTVAAVGINWLIQFFSSFQSGFGAIVSALIVGLLTAFLMIAGMRILLEFFVNNVQDHEARTAERRAAEAGSDGAAQAGLGESYSPDNNSADVYGLGQHYQQHPGQ